LKSFPAWTLKLLCLKNKPASDSPTQAGHDIRIVYREYSIDMNPIRLFISSVQKEFAAERAALRNYLRGDALMRRFFDAFLFEDVPAADHRY
jgi:hypothetical protein